MISVVVLTAKATTLTIKETSGIRQWYNLQTRRLFMTDAERRSVEDFYAHRALVLKRIQQALKEQNAKTRK